MKKNFLFTALSLSLCIGFTSCSDDNDEPQAPVYEEALSGIYVINQGNMGAKISGSITAYDFAKGSATQNAFSAANANTPLGDTPQSAIIHGSKMYVAVYESNIIRVLDTKTLKEIKRLTPAAPAASPRYFAAKDGYVYASMYTGQVCRIDTATLEIDKTVEVGNNPEQMAIAGDKLYVANSDGMNWQGGYVNCSMSIIDLPGMSERKIDVGLNPTDVATNGTDVFVICKGNYADVPSTVKKISGNSAVDIAPATMMAVSDDELFVIDAPYGGSISYKVYSTTGSSTPLRDMVSDGVDYPAGIGIDPVSKDLVILSYNVGAEGYALYQEAGYAQIYSNAGVPTTKFNVGVGPCQLVFNHSFVEVK